MTAPPPPAPAAGVPAEVAERRCLNCGAAGVRAYCPDCGQEHEPATEVAFQHVAAEVLPRTAWADFVSARLFRTLRALVVRPGLLTAEYLAGRRERYLTPGGLFALLNGAFFAVAQYFHPQSADEMLAAFGYGPANLAAMAAANGMTAEALTARLEASYADVAPTVYAVTVPLFGLAVWLLYRRSGRSPAAHAVFALHALALNLVLNILNAPLAAFHFTGLTLVSAALIYAAPAAWLVPALRRAYGEPWRTTAWKATALVLWLFVCVGAWYLLSVVIVVRRL